MSETIGKATAQTSECVLNDLHHVRVEGEGVLPDYCDDIHRIIRTEPKAIVRKKRAYVADGKLICEVQGSVVFQIIYRAEEAGEVLSLSSANFSEEFTENFEVPFEGELGEPYALFCEVLPASAGCRAVSKKKCVYSASVSVQVRLYANRPLICLAPGAHGVEALEETVSVTRLCVFHEETFEVEEEIVLPQDSPSILSLLDCEMRAHPQWTKCSDGELEFCISANLSCAYDSEAGEEGVGRLCSFTQPMEITEKISLPGVFASSNVELAILPGTLKAEVTSDAYGARRALKVHLAYLTCTAVYEREELRLLRDAYVLSGECELTEQSGEWACLTHTDYSECRPEMRISCDDALCAVENCKATLQILSAAVEEGAAVLECEIRAGALGVREEDQRTLNLEESTRTRLEVKLPARSVSERSCLNSVQATVLSASAEIKEREVLLCLKVGVTLTLCEKEKKTYLSDLVITGRKTEQDARICFYYPSPSESLWEIAKTFRVCPKTLMKQNGLKENAPLPHMLLIAT